jgi:hypothetical protein
MTIITPDTSLIGVSQEKTAPESKEQEIPTDPEGIKTKYGEHRILNDDEIIATISKPEDILHLY